LAEKTPPHLFASKAGSHREHQALHGLLWLALGICFSPVLTDLARHLVAEPWARYVLLFPLLLARCALRERSDAPSARMGAVLLVIGLVVELVAVGGGFVRLGRLGLPLAVIGMSRAFGLLPQQTALLALWWVPIPHAVVSLHSPALETAWLHLAAWPLDLIGADIGVGAALVRAGGGELALSDPDGGLPLAALLSGLGWYTSARLGEGLWRCLRRAVSWAVLAFPLQVTALGLAVAGLVLGVPGESLQLFLRLFWIPAAVAGLLFGGRCVRARGDES
jgi:hypothetical protein